MILDLTIAIPVKNEESNLPGCLHSIGENFAKEIVIIDSDSNDNTLAIANDFNVKVVNFTWNGSFPKKRNWFLREHTPTTKWVLFLDADEYLTEEFKEELKSALAGSSYVGFWLNYTIYFMGAKLKGGYPLNKLALFQTGMGEYEYIEEKNWSKLDMEIHEHPILNGPIGTIKSKIDHRDFRGISHYVAKHNEYSNWEAFRFNKLATERVNGQTWKQKLKYKLVTSPLAGPLFFIGSYVFMGGFRDGSRGFVFALFKMNYFTQVYAKIKERQLNSSF